MLKQTNSYQTLIENFRWEIPEFYNIATDVCDKWALLEPERLALIHVDESQNPSYFSFLDIKRLSNQTANLYRDYGVISGDRVAVLLPQAPETAYAHVAAYKLGAISIPLFTLFGVEALEYRFVNAGIKAVITDAEGLTKLASIADKLPELEIVFCIDSLSQSSQDLHKSFEVAKSFQVIDFHVERNKHSDVFDVVNTKATDPAFLIYTSGTTGPPKGALHAHQCLLGHLPGVEMSHNFIQEGDLFWTPADWAWIGGLFDVLMPAWQNGVAVLSHRFKKFSAEAAFELMERFEVRNAFLPPTALKLMRSVKNPRERYNLQLRSIASAGESVGTELLTWAEASLGISINEFYGQTEFNMVVSSCNAIMKTKAGWIGKAVAGQELAIVDDSGHVLPYGQLGQIAIKPPNPVMFLGYWNNVEATAKKFLGDWFITGDVGEMDSEGYIRFVSRNDDVITSSGYRIGPSEIEDCLLGHPSVTIAAVVGMPDELRTEIIKAFIVLEDSDKASQQLKEDIQNYVKTRLAAHEYPREIEFVSALPMTTTGKIIRHKLRSGDVQ